ncbi:MAG: tRNA pseudouridine(55) synthase TruB, partial [Chloroflexi bacterium]
MSCALFIFAAGHKLMSKKQNVSGILNIDKPKGLTSHDVVAQVRRLSRQRRVGHAGTLDPMATGVLLVCLGQATRLIEYLMQSQKQYRAVIRFGITTNTLDAEGEVTAVRDASGLTEADIRRVLPDFLGQIEQIPPAFSAIKQGGKPLYRLARAGQPVEVPPRQVVIESLEWVDWSPPDLTLDVTCSPGTYIRSLARDLGDALGVGAHLAGLTRTASGSWTLAEAVSLDTLHAAADRSPEGWRQYLQTPDRAVAHLPAVRLDADTARRVRHGQQVDLP